MIQNLKDTVIQHFLSFLNRIGLLIFGVGITYFYLYVFLVLCLLLSVKADANLQLASVVSSCSLFIEPLQFSVILLERRVKERTDTSMVSGLKLRLGCSTTEGKKRHLILFHLLIKSK